jgi:tetratricopeptide (TPR) repeat protein
MTKSPAIALYNQDRSSDEAFLAHFVARNPHADALLNSLRHIADGGPTEHQILIGTRGMGKTSLLRRLAIGVSDDPDLKAAFIPLRFREEQYNVISLNDFWRNCGEALAEWCEQNGKQAQADQLDRAIETPTWRDDDLARDAFLAACEAAGGRPILLLDNLDLILEGIKADGCWSLRAALQAKNGPIVIGAATQLLAQGADRGAAFYEFFHPHILEPLTERELLACLSALASQRGEAGAPVKTILAREPERVRALYVLTGGNPRILGLVYGLLEQQESAEIFADLEALLDQVTPFYKARIEEYQTPLQRAVIDGIALNWDPITSGALSKQSGIAPQTLSAQLDRLKKDGLIEAVESSGANAGFQLAERFLNIWYLMRHGTRKTKQKLRWFTIFLTRLFNAEELARMAGEARTGNGRWRGEHVEAVIEAYKLKMQGVARDEKPSEAFEIARELFRRANALIESDRPEGAIAIYDEMIARVGSIDETALYVLVARALVNKGVALGMLSRSEDEIAVYDEIFSRFGESDEKTLQVLLAMVLFNKGITLGALGQHVGAIAAYDEAIARFGGSEETALQELVAMALVNKGVRLRTLGRSEDPTPIFDEVIARFGGSDDTALQVQVAKALVGKGFTLDTLGRSDDVIAVYDEVIERFGGSKETALQRQVATAHVHISTHLFWYTGQLDAAETRMRTVLERDPEHVLGRANLLWVLIAMGQIDEARTLMAGLDMIKGGGRALMFAGLALGADNFGASVDHLKSTLDQGLDAEKNNAIDFSEDLLWYLRIAAARGFGERLIAWFSESGNADRYAPVYGAFVAHVRGERMLLDLNPEVRGVAQPLYARLSAGKDKGDTKPMPKRGGRKGKR